MPSILTDLSDPALTQAMEANLEESYVLLTRIAEAVVYDGPDMLRVCTGVPHFMVNGVVRIRLSEEKLEDRIEATLGYFRSRRLPMLWMLGPSSRPVNLGDHLLAHGLMLASAMPGMVLNLQRLSASLSLPPGVTIEEATGKEALQHWAQAGHRSFDMPLDIAQVLAAAQDQPGYGSQAPLRSFVAYQEGEPIGASSLYLGAGVAGLYCVGVVPEARRQGIGAAITTAPLLLARDLGYRIGVLQASPMGEPVYRRLGFQEHGQFTLYIAGLPPTLNGNRAASFPHSPAAGE